MRTISPSLICRMNSNKYTRLDWNRSNSEEESIMVEERESQQHTKLAHSIEEILRRPACVKRETRLLRNWSVIKENTRTSTGIFLLYLLFSVYMSLERDSKKLYFDRYVASQTRVSKSQHRLHKCVLFYFFIS